MLTFRALGLCIPPPRSLLTASVLAMGRSTKRGAAAAAGGKEDAPSEEPAPKKTARGGSRGGSKAAEPAAAADDAPPPPAASGRKRAAAGKAKAAAAAGGGASSKPKPDFYLMKSEPDTFSLEDLEGRPSQTEHWEGVRNFVARNHMQGMRVGDRAFFYHSSCKVPGIVAIVKVVKEAYPDHTQFDPSSEYYDARSTQEAPKWHMVDIQLERKLSRQITLEELKGHKAGALSGMALFNTARLSVQPVTTAEWDFILGLEGQEPPPLKGGKAAAAAAGGGGEGGAAAAAKGSKGGGGQGSSRAGKKK